MPSVSKFGHDFRDRLPAIRTALRAGRISEVFRLCFFKTVPGIQSPWALIRDAAIEEREGRDAEAAQLWRKAATLQSDPYWALFGLARSLQRLGQADEACQTMSRALALPSAEPGGIRFAATLDLQSGRFDEAEAKFSSFGLSDHERRRTILGSLPGMTSEAERWALYEAARGLHGVGHAVDIGCWLGSLTTSIALGLEGNARARDAGVRIHAYDVFVWHAMYMDSYWNAALPMARPADGESFLPAFQLIVGPWNHLIETHSDDLMRVRWTGEPIELLSVDAMKTPELAGRITSEFYPALLPGKSVLFHQDFCHSYTWWIHLHHFRLRHHFELIDSLKGSGGVLFRFVRPFQEGELAMVSNADLSDKELADEAFSYSMDLVAPADRGAIAAAFIRCELAHGRTQRASKLMRQYRQDPAADRQLAGLKEWSEAG
jgi:hypothetical protein